MTICQGIRGTVDAIESKKISLVDVGGVYIDVGIMYGGSKEVFGYCGRKGVFCYN